MREASVMTSLHELRAIEQQRIVDERTAFERQRAAEAEAVRVAEQARIDAAAARERAEREERLRIEQARADAEREARMRIETTEAAERARLAAQLEQERLQQELELRRAEVAKKRPTWMVAVTTIALVAGAALAIFAVDRMHEAEVAQTAKARADADKAQARKEAADAVAKVDAMQRDLDELEGKVGQAQHALDVAQTEIERRHAQELLDAAKRRVADARARAAAIQKERDDAARRAGYHLDDCGANNVLCRKQP
jgi:hypothetical protein